MQTALTRQSANPFTYALTAALALLMATSCTQEIFSTTEAEAGTPVSLSVKLTANGTATTRTGSRANIPTTEAEAIEVLAADEITANSTLNEKYLYLPALRGYQGNNTAQSSALLKNNKLSALKLVTPDASITPKGSQLYTKHLRSNRPQTAGIVLVGTNRNVIMYGNTTATKFGTYSFEEMKHVNTKVSVLLRDQHGNAITNATKVEMLEVLVLKRVLDIEQPYDKPANIVGNCIIGVTYKASWLTEARALNKQDAYPDLWNCITVPSYSPRSNTSVLIQYDNGGHAPDGIHFGENTKLQISLPANAANNTPAITYTLLFSDILLEDLKAGDPRIAKGNKLSYFITGEHVIITVTIDEKQHMTGNATVGEWKTATAHAGTDNPSTDDGIVPAKK